MSMTETLDRVTPSRGDAAEAVDKAEATRTALSRRAQSLSERAQQLRDRAQDLADRAQTLTARAQDFASRAPGQARRELARRRSMAATRLESLAETIRPDEEARAARNRKTAVVAGGSSVALVAVLGLGVALGFYLNRELQKRAQAREAAGRDSGESRMTAAAQQPEERPFPTAGGLPH